MRFRELMELIGEGVDVAGVAVIVLGAIIATVHFLARLRGRVEFQTAYTLYRNGLGRALLLGLEFLIAADIIRTVAVTPTLRDVAVLAIIVAIRTFISLELERQIDGRPLWPGSRSQSPAGGGDKEP